MKRIYHLLLALLVTALAAQHIQAQKRSTEEFMASAGFTQNAEGQWVMGEDAIVIMNGNSVESFSATQTHDWELVFGNGGSLGKTIQIKKGDKIEFANGIITLGDGSTFQPGDPMILKMLQDGDDEEALKSYMLTRGILRSAIFNKQRNQLSATDIKTYPEMDGSLGMFFDPQGNAYKLDEYGNFADKLDAAAAAHAQQQKKAIADAEAAAYRADEAEYEELCKKYGKNVIDALGDGKIAIGAPIDLVKRMMGNKVEKPMDMDWQPTVFTEDATHATLKFTPQGVTRGQWHNHYFVTYEKRNNTVTHYYVDRRYY